MNYDLISIKSGIEELGIFEKNSDAWVTTRDIAKLFGKEHSDVLWQIREQIIPSLSESFVQGNFPPISMKDSYGRKQPVFLLNRKSFSLVAMGFTGKKAMAFKEAYVEAFEAMCTVIDTRKLSKNGYKEMTGAIAKRYNDQRVFANEADMINQIILGMSASDFKAVNGIDPNGITRDSVVFSKLDKLDKAQRLNAQLITAGLGFDTRKEIIISNFKRS